jgi:hypothetical protein
MPQPRWWAGPAVLHSFSEGGGRNGRVMSGVSPRGFTIGVLVSAFVRRAVAVAEDDAGLADDPADGGVGVAFLAAFPFDEDGAALGRQGDAGLTEAFEELFRLPPEFGLEGFRLEGGGRDAEVREVVPEPFRDGHGLAIPGEVEAADQVDSRPESVRLRLALVEIMKVIAVGVGRFLDVRLRGFEELDLEDDAAIRVRAAESHPIGIDGFIPVRLWSLIRSLSDDRHRGERGKREEGTAFHDCMNVNSLAVGEKEKDRGFSSFYQIHIFRRNYRPPEHPPIRNFSRKQFPNRARFLADADDATGILAEEARLGFLRALMDYPSNSMKRSGVMPALRIRARRVPMASSL